MMTYPKFFDVKHYMLNAHMTMSNKVNYEKAMGQWATLHSTLIRLGVKVDLVDPAPGLVDMVFSANAGIVLKNTAIVASFGAEPRRPESDHWLRYFQAKGFDCIDPRDDDVKIEGCGDFMSLQDGSHHFMAHGFRSDQKAYPWFLDVMNMKKENVSSLKLTNPNFYHIDTALLAMSRGHLMYVPTAFDEAGIKRIHEVAGSPKNTIKLSEEDAMAFACNSVNFVTGGVHYVVGNKFSKRLTVQLHHLGYEPIGIGYDEFLKAGGSTRCSVLDVGRDVHTADLYVNDRYITDPGEGEDGSDRLCGAFTSYGRDSYC